MAPATARRRNNRTPTGNPPSKQARELDEEDEQKLAAVVLEILQKSEDFASLLSSKLVTLERKLDEMKVAISEELEVQKRQMLNAVLQKKLVAKDLTKQREERGGYSCLQELVNDRTVVGKLER
jgi:hypothetical protein